jgi:hypothetical protein
VIRLPAKIITVEILDKLPEEGGKNIAKKSDVEIIVDRLAELPNRVHRNYWFIVLGKDRIVETPTEFLKRNEAEIRKWNKDAQPNVPESTKPKGNYFG